MPDHAPSPLAKWGAGFSWGFGVRIQGASHFTGLSPQDQLDGIKPGEIGLRIQRPPSAQLLTPFLWGKKGGTSLEREMAGPAALPGDSFEGIGGGV